MAKRLESQRRKPPRRSSRCGRPASLDVYRRLEAFDNGFLREVEDLLAGIDEAGRGALAGPVVAAAVILPRDSGLIGVDDSKRLTESRREALFSDIVGKALSVGIGVGQPSLIDARNILNATLIAMARAVGNLGVEPGTVLVDGRDRIEHSAEVISVIGGDRKSLAVAAASIVAKVARDRLMRRLHKRYPEYNFLNNKGYGTKEHLNAISRYGTISAHRKSYRLKTVEKSLSLF